MRQSTNGSSIENIQRLLKLAEGRGSVRKEVDIIASGAGVPSVDAAAWMGVSGLYGPAGWERLQHWQDSLPLLFGGVGSRDAPKLPVDISEAPLGRNPLGDLPHQQDAGAAHGPKAHVTHPKMRRKFSKAAREKMRQAQLTRWAAKKGLAPAGKTPAPAKTDKTKKRAAAHRYPSGKGYGVKDLEAFFLAHPGKDFKAADIVKATKPAKREAAAGNIPPALVGLAVKGFLDKVDMGTYRLHTKVSIPTAAKKKSHHKPAAPKASQVQTVTPEPVPGLVVTEATAAV